MNKEIYRCENDFDINIVSTWLYNLYKDKISKGLANIVINTELQTVTLNEIV